MLKRLLQSDAEQGGGNGGGPDEDEGEAGTKGEAVGGEKGENANLAWYVRGAGKDLALKNCEFR